jgi:hypothetical protein
MESGLSFVFNAICPIANSPGAAGIAKAFPDGFQLLLTQVPMGQIDDCVKDIAPVDGRSICQCRVCQEEE